MMALPEEIAGEAAPDAMAAAEEEAAVAVKSVAEETSGKTGGDRPISTILIVIGVDSVGTVSSALLTFASIQALKPDLVINAGTAGGFKVCYSS
ncbi:hypothetical protein BHE74_00031243 [Ensete ventricosum]|uniref:Nucleoside phosphorylase domain-containing protein n=1 Tax=Ensete ventricosum TaxID=4639 RepID=A0A444C9I4_ENSVE|nr:hypothetical protein B296_00040328 [Ensete ventricosum]RWV82538.1 hypothetical protein GW17_00055954 [Ensete ventricosum]RWW61684.1 hypothetical protein BHE74_00031243 [Ensete ventricosum]RZS01549.1 hypothetical protein BHM03_00031418 [Ensete ventricosum]